MVFHIAVLKHEHRAAPILKSTPYLVSLAGRERELRIKIIGERHTIGSSCKVVLALGARPLIETMDEIIAQLVGKATG